MGSLNIILPNVAVLDHVIQTMLYSLSVLKEQFHFCTVCAKESDVYIKGNKQWLVLKLWWLLRVVIKELTYMISVLFVMVITNSLWGLRHLPQYHISCLCSLMLAVLAAKEAMGKRFLWKTLRDVYSLWYLGVVIEQRSCLTNRKIKGKNRTSVLCKIKP